MELEETKRGEERIAWKEFKGTSTVPDSDKKNVISDRFKKTPPFLFDWNEWTMKRSRYPATIGLWYTNENLLVRTKAVKLVKHLDRCKKSKR